MLVAPDFKIIDRIVNFHIRNNKNIIKLLTQIIIEVIKDFPLTIDFNDHDCKCMKNFENITKDDLNK